MASFKKVLKDTLNWEKGFQMNPADTGNYNSVGRLVGTNKGISALVYETWINRPPTVADMKAITTETATKIYYKKYWLPMNGNKINNQDVASLMFFISENAGLGKNAEFVRRIFGTKDKYSISDKTVKLINKNSRKFFNAYYKHAYNFYNSGNPVFRKGWLRRLKTHKYGNNALIFAVLGTASIYGLYKIFTR